MTIALIKDKIIKQLIDIHLGFVTRLYFHVQTFLYSFNLYLYFLEESHKQVLSPLHKNTQAQRWCLENVDVIGKINKSK